MYIGSPTIRLTLSFISTYHDYVLLSRSSSTARSSSFSGSARPFTEPHLHLPPVKELPPIRKKTADNAAQKSPPPRLSITKEKRALRWVMKRLIKKTAKGSIAKVRRGYPGTASLRGTRFRVVGW